METFRVEFRYTRTVVTHLAAESAEEIHDFIEETDWNIIEDAPELIDEDDSDIDYDEEGDGDYFVEPAPGIVANYGIHEGEIREMES